MENGRIDLYDSNKMDLCMPEDPLTKITNGTIVKMRRPRGEKESVKDAEEEAANEQKMKEVEGNEEKAIEGGQESLFG
ncbi:hypothetical protein KA405_06310 [Patescibacteria group bacterium]|nr:hypothetical protein [Patescibacteria group bacterium]